MLDDYATVRRYIEDVNRLPARSWTRPRVPLWLPLRLSDTEIIRMALSRSASAGWRE